MFQWHTLMTYHKMLLHYIPVWHMLYIYDIHSWHNDSMTYSMIYTKRLCVNDIFNDICSSWHTCMTHNNDIPPNIHDIWNPGIVMVPKHSWHTLMTYAYVIRYVIVIFRYVMAAYVIKSTRICHSTREFTDVWSTIIWIQILTRVKQSHHAQYRQNNAENCKDVQILHQKTNNPNPTDTQFRDPQHKLSRGENAYSNYAFDDGPVCEAFILKNAKNVEFVESPWI